MTPLEYFRLFAPAFAAVDDSTVGKWLTIAGSIANAACLDAERAAMAQAYYAAHLISLTTDTANGVTGPVKSEKEGDLSRSYGTVSGDDTWLGQTPYGLAFINLTGPCSGASIMTRMG